MSSKPELIAEAVITHLTNGSFAYPLAVSKKLVPVYDRDQLSEGWEVTVHVGPQTRTKQARSGTTLKVYQIGIVLRYQPVPAELENDSVEKVLQVSEEIMDSLDAFKPIEGFVIDEIEQSDPFSLSKQDESGYYLTQIFARYKGF
jgi:hypothetical protein